MTESSASAAAARWCAPLFWLLPPLFELPALVALYSGIPEVGREAAFGTPASQVAVLVALLAALFGFVVAVRGATALTRAAVAGLLSVSAGVVAALAAGFFLDGMSPLLGVLPAHSALALAMLARATLRRSAGT